MFNYGQMPPYYPPFPQYPFPPQQPVFDLKKAMKARRKLDAFIASEEKKKKENEKKPDKKKFAEKQLNFLEVTAILLLFGPMVGAGYLHLLKVLWPH